MTSDAVPKSNFNFYTPRLNFFVRIVSVVRSTFDHSCRDKKFLISAQVGWQVTVDQYFYEQVFYIYDTVLERLEENPDRKFIAVEIGFFARWWDEAPVSKQQRMAAVIESDQLEFINGGWCMHDEATPTFIEMTDQTTRGHQFIYKHFGKKPRGTWSIDPFGHTNTQAWLLGYDAGMPSLFWGRMDWQDREMRFDASEGEVKGFEWIWQGSDSLPDKQIFAGNLFGTGGGGYSTWFNFDTTNQVDQVQDDPEMMDYNVDQWVDKFVQNAQTQHEHALTDHIIFACGTDFQYTNADYWYRNLDKLIHYVNLNGTVNAFYSTPTLYTDQKMKDPSLYQVRTSLDDIMPLADDAHDYWSGFFTSRPALKRQVRMATNLLTAARFLEIVGLKKGAVDMDRILATPVFSSESKITLKPAPRVGDSWTDGLEGAVALATHHDGMSGTERQDVTDDYELRIAQQALVAEQGILETLKDIVDVDVPLATCNCNGAPEKTCLNASACVETSGRDEFTVLAWNSLAQARTETIRLPVGRSNSWTCSDSAGVPLKTGILILDDRTKDLPTLYLNKQGLSTAEVSAAETKLRNTAQALLSIQVPLPALGLTKFDCTYPKVFDDQPTTIHQIHYLEQEEEIEKRRLQLGEKTDNTQAVCNEYYCVTLDTDTKELVGLENIATGISTKLTATWGWYNSSVGGCTEYPPEVSPTSPACSNQKSGAYIFRPNSSEVFGFDEAFEKTMDVTIVDTVAEIRFASSPFTSHVIRLFDGEPFVEIEWTAGPIPIDTPWFDPVAFDGDTPLPNNWGKEVILKLSSDLETNGTFYTDSNGREMIHRVKDHRGPTYPDPYYVSEPIAGNYFPVTYLAALDDGVNELNVAVDAALGAASIDDGSLEFMVHRRIQDDDARGVQEPLNETMCGCNDINAAPGDMGEFGHEGDGGCLCEGLTVRGKFRVSFDSIATARAQRRTNALHLNYPATLAFLDVDHVNPIDVSILSTALPSNVQLLTLSTNYASFQNGAWLLRFAHLFQQDEHPTLSKPVTINLSDLFNGELTILNATETLLTANQPKLPPDPSFDFPNLTISPMEVRTFLAYFA